MNRWLNIILFQIQGIVVINTGDTDIHGANTPCKCRNRIFYAFVMHNAVIRKDLSIILFCNAAGKASTNFHPRLEVL